MFEPTSKLIYDGNDDNTGVLDHSHLMYVALYHLSLPFSF